MEHSLTSRTGSSISAYRSVRGSSLSIRMSRSIDIGQCKAQDGIGTANRRPRHVSGVRELMPSYEGVLLDQFGVLHDGRVPYPGAINAVKVMYEAGLKIVLVSNSSGRATKALDRLEGLGFPRQWFSGAVTSGELTFLHLRDRPSSFWSNLGTKIIHFTWCTRGHVDLSGLNLDIVNNPSEADFILAHGTEAMAQPEGDPQLVELDTMKAVLEECAKREDKKIPMIVANPDLVTVDSTQNIVMPGTLGKFYEGLGGYVEWMGKPSSIIYESSMDMIGVPQAKVIAIGDSLGHDIAGASDANVDSLFICGGIHARDVELTGESFDEAKMDDLCSSHSVIPTFVSAYFQV